MPRLVLAAVVLGLAVASGTGGAASGLRVRSLHAHAYPDLVRATLTFQGGAIGPSDVFALDPIPFADGRAALRLTGARGLVRPVRVDGTSIRLSQRRDRVVVHLVAPPRQFKYFGYHFATNHERLVLELWRSAPPVSPVPIGASRCLVLQHWVVSGGTTTARGTERSLFEHMFLVRIRNLRGAVLATRGVASSEGRWRTHVSYRVTRTQAGTLEAVDTSEGDGSVVCLAEVKVTLRP